MIISIKPSNLESEQVSVTVELPGDEQSFEDVAPVVMNAFIVFGFHPYTVRDLFLAEAQSRIEAEGVKS